MKWIIDTDYSSNSQVAIDILIQHKFDIVAITLSSGVSNSRPIDSKRKLEADLLKLNVTIPIYLGATQSYINYQKELGDSEIIDPYTSSKGSGVVNDGSKLPDVNVDESAAVKIIELIKTHGKELNILCLSSLTNLSLSVLLDNTIPELFNKLYICGGSSTGLSNSGTATEANFRADPIAAKNVILYYPNVYLLPLEIEDSFAHLSKNQSVDFGKYTDYVYGMIKEGKSILQILAVAYFLNSKVVKTEVTFPADVDITGKYTRGALSLEKYPWIESGKYSKTVIAEELDFEQLVQTVKKF
jgi:inosine-uridine nucleoside N-ribohydrolase